MDKSVSQSISSDRDQNNQNTPGLIVAKRTASEDPDTASDTKNPKKIKTSHDESKESDAQPPAAVIRNVPFPDKVCILYAFIPFAVFCISLYPLFYTLYIGLGTLEKVAPGTFYLTHY